MELETLLTTSQVAEAFSVAPSTITRWCRRGKIRYITHPGGQYRIPVSEVERFLTPSITSVNNQVLVLPGQTELCI